MKESSSIEEMEKIKLELHQENINLVNYKEEGGDVEGNEEYIPFNYYDTTVSIVLRSFSTMIVFLQFVVAEIVLIAFSKGGGSNTFQSLSSALPIYGIFSYSITFAFSLGYAIQAAKYYAAKEYRNFNILTLKGLVSGYILGVVVFIIVNIFASLFINSMLSDKELAANAIKVLRILSISIMLVSPFNFYFRYLSAIDKITPVTIMAIISFGFLIIFYLISTKVFQSYLIGLPVSLDIYFLVLFIQILLYYYFIDDTVKFNRIGFAEFSDNYFNFLKFSCLIGITIVISYISNQIVPIMGYLVDDKSVSMYSLIFQIFTFFTMICECFSLVGSIELNYYIGRKRFNDLHKILILNFSLITVILTLALIAIIIFYQNIITTLTSDKEIIERLISIKFQLCFCILFNGYQIFFVETLSSLNYAAAPLLITILCRYIIFISFCYIFVYGTSMGFLSIMNSLVISIILENLINGIVLFFKIKNSKDDIQMHKIE